MVSKLLYLSENLRVFAAPGGDRDRWFVTFDSLRPDSDLGRPGFGEDFFRQRGLSAIHVLGAGNDWYHYPDIDAAIAAILAEIGAASHRITYGSSMGGYAAIRFADALGATACLALSPQYSIDPAKAPFEQRWRQHAHRIAWRADIDGPIACRCAPVIAYDDRGDDARHVALIAQDIAIRPLPLSHASHPTGFFLQGNGLLERLLIDLHAGACDVAAIGQAAHASRKLSPVWLGELARRQPRHRPRIALELARRGLALSPGNDLMTHILAERLIADGALAEGLEMHRVAWEQSGRGAGYGFAYSIALMGAGDPRKAFSVALAIWDKSSSDASLAAWISEIAHQLRASATAIRWGAIAARLAPGEAHYRNRLRNFREAAHPAAIRRLRAWWRRLRERRLVNA